MERTFTTTEHEDLNTEVDIKTMTGEKVTAFLKRGIQSKDKKEEDIKDIKESRTEDKLPKQIEKETLKKQPKKDTFINELDSRGEEGTVRRRTWAERTFTEQKTTEHQEQGKKGAPCV